MTDNEIVKALECCKNGTLNDCDGCPCFCDEDINTARECAENLMSNSLDLINRIQAENERLGNAYKQCAYERDVFLRENPVEMALLIDEQAEKLKTAKAEAYKKCIEKMKEYIDTHEHLSCEECECVPISKDGFDNLLKEMVGEDSADR